jgi:hypothetical protein
MAAFKMAAAGAQLLSGDATSRSEQPGSELRAELAAADELAPRRRGEQARERRRAAD